MHLTDLDKKKKKSHFERVCIEKVYTECPVKNKTHFVFFAVNYIIFFLGLNLPTYLIM